MNDVLILGTDTDAGKTTLALLWLAALADEFAYWKPVETGPSDSDVVRRLVPAAIVHAPALRFEPAVAPPLAARSAGATIPPARELARSKPTPTSRLLIETFGGPFSPLNEHELQVELIRALRVPSILVSSSALGAIGRTLQALRGLEAEGILPRAMALVGAPDVFAVEQVRLHRPGLPVFVLRPPASWDAEGVRVAASSQASVLREIRDAASEPTAGLVAEELLLRDRQEVWHPYTALRDRDAPLVCVGAEDEFLELADGRSVIDAISSWWTILHGHRHPPLMRALHDAAASLDHVLFAGVTHRDAVGLAGLLLRSMPWPAGRVFYSDNGSTAVEVALKLAYQFWCHRGEPGRTRFVGFTHGYHGDTFGAMAVSRDPVFFNRFEPLLLQADILPLDPERLASHLKQHRAKVAAVIAEPLVQGAGGMRMHSPETLRELAQAAREHDVLFIADEVMTGGGRTGTLWAHQAAGVVPDLVCAAKTLTGGVLPLAATLVAPRVVEAFETEDRGRTFFHGHSFTANPLACAVARANLELLLSRELTAPRRLAVFWEASLGPLRGEARVKDVRVCGSIGAVELDVPGGYLAEAGRGMRRVCLERGVFLRPLGNVLYALPPFCTSDGSLGRIAEAMAAAVRSLGE